MDNDCKRLHPRLRKPMSIAQWRSNGTTNGVVFWSPQDRLWTSTEMSKEAWTRTISIDQEMGGINRSTHAKCNRLHLLVSAVSKFLNPFIIVVLVGIFCNFFHIIMQQVNWQENEEEVIHLGVRGGFSASPTSCLWGRCSVYNQVYIRARVRHYATGISVSEGKCDRAEET